MSKVLQIVNGHTIYESLGVGDTITNVDGKELTVKSEKDLQSLKAGDMPKAKPKAKKSA